MTAGRRVSGARRLLAGLAAAYLAAVAIGLPVAKTREALNAGLLVPPPAAGVDWFCDGHPPHGNPDNDLSDAIPVTGLFVFASSVPTLDAPFGTPGAVVGGADAPRPRLFRARQDFERGPPSLT